MTYGTISTELRVRCRIDEDDSDEDYKLTIALEQADAWLEERFRPHIDVDLGTVVTTFPTYTFGTFPLTEIPALAMDAYYDRAAGCYNQVKMPLDIDPSWFAKADSKFKEFEDANWGQYFSIIDLDSEE